jgi:DNA-binding beta-propeller fold protein YncE
MAGASACVGIPASRPAWNDPGVRLTWPLPPEPPRIQYLGALRSEADLGRKIGLMERLGSLLFGSERRAMIKPVAVARNNNGLLVVADPGLPTVHFFDLERRRYWRLDDKLAALLRSPVGVAIDDSARAYVADSVRGRVFVFDEGRRLVAEFGEGTISRPTGLALDHSQELLYVVDTIDCRIVVFDRAGREVGTFGRRGAGSGEFNFPTYITVGSEGRVSVSDSLNFRVQVFDPGGAAVGAFGEAGDGAGSFTRPKGIAADASGRLYVVDAAFENVQIFGPDGTLLLAFGGPGNDAGEFSLPTGLFLDSTNTIWVADSFNQRVQAFRLLMNE